MRRKKELLLVIVGWLSFLWIHAQVDATLTQKTKTLYQNLKVIQTSNNFMFGQEFFNSFHYSSGSAHGEETISDSKDVTGSHPAVLGSDFHYYLEKDATEKGYHTDAVKWAYQQGYVITFDWHVSARNSSPASYTCASAPVNLAKNIANGNTNGDRDWYLAELDKVINIINQDLKVNNDTIPIVFRPLHEMNGNWFWWGNSCSGFTAAEYKLLYQLVVDYVKVRTKSVLFCWSPNTPFGETYYPGDDYVDIVGVDIYDASITSLRTEVGKVVDFAQAHNKIAVLSETGDVEAKGTNAPLYWKNIVLPGILDDPSGKSKKIAWALTWINASWANFPYVAHSASSSTVKQSFIAFKNSPNVLFGNELPFDLYAPYEPPVTAVPETLPSINFYPIPARGELSIELKGFENPVSITLFDTMGRVLSKNNYSINEDISQPTGQLSTGVYLMLISDGVRTIKKSFVVGPR